MKNIYFRNLDGLRLIAFLAIFVHHGIFTNDANFTESIFFKSIEIIKKPAGLGVPFFFCLSGFLITYLLLSENDLKGKINIKNFYVRRILRIWPLYYAVVVFGFFIFSYIRSFIYETPYIESASLWKYLLFLSNFDQLEKGLPYGAGLGVTWSLSVEEQFYLFWPLLLTLVPQKYYLHFFIGLFLSSTIFMQLGYVRYNHTFGSASDLSLGAILAFLSYKRVSWVIRLQELSRKHIITIYFLGIILIYSWAVFGIGERFLVSIFMIFVIFEQCYCKNSIIKMGDFKRVSFLGTLTYGFYLLHTISNFITHNFLKLFGDFNPLTHMLVQFSFSLSLTFILGYFSYNYFEKPFLNLKKRFAVISTGPK